MCFSSDSSRNDISDTRVPLPPLWDFSLLASLLCAFFSYLMRRHAWVKFLLWTFLVELNFSQASPSPTCTVRKGFLVTCTKFKSPGSARLMACPFILEMSWRSQVEPSVSSIGKEGRTVCERGGEKIHVHFIQVIPPLLSFSATSLCIFSLNPLIYTQAFL